jgi:hypothetical protein
MNFFVVALAFMLCLSTVAASKNRTEKAKRDDDTCPFGVKEYMGCFQMSADIFVDGPYYDEVNGLITADVCGCECGKLGYQYTSIEGGSDCYCGDSYDDTATSQDCSASCPDDATESCGGNDYSIGAVYKTTIGCTPACGQGQTCANFGSFYWCTPDCDFTVALDYQIPCGNSGQVTLDVQGGNQYSHAFNVTLDGAAPVNGTYNNSMTYTFNVGESHNFTITNLFGCSVNQTITLPIPSAPNAMQAPILVFDVSTMNMSIMYYKLVYPSYTGGLVLSKYSISYRHQCPNGTFSDWSVVNSTATAESVQVPFEYGLEYEAKVFAENCLGAGLSSPSTTSLAPSSPYQPLISEVHPADGLPTTGGSITLLGKYFTANPILRADDVVVIPTSAADGQIVVALGAGAGNVKLNVLTTANFPCQTLISPDFTWSYSIPVINTTSVLSNAGGNLTITGTNFGAAGNLTVGIDETLCSGCTRTVAHTEIKCTGCPAGNGDGHELKVQVQGLVSAPFPFTFAICDPMCVFGECVGNNVCSCEDGYGGSDCSVVHVCAGTQAFSESTCGECSQTSSTCCVFKP